MDGDAGFEARHWDGAARTGDLRVPSGRSLDTPALLPVVNPRRDTVAADDLAAIGAEACITNAYICYGDDDLRSAARERGIHDLLRFNGVVMTDSGAFQLAEYGDIDATNEDLIEFQRDIGVDIVTPVDIPTPPEADRSTAAADLETTADRIETARGIGTGDAFLAAPIQGGTYPSLRERAGRSVAGAGGVYPVGGVVPLLRDYRFDAVVRAVRAAKRGVGPAAPVHLFGAGHPMAFALAAACGCDLFDSAAYALYAREDRYLTVRGTRDLDMLDAFPCPCPVCVDHDPGSLRNAPPEERESLLARHNLHVSFAELRRVRGAIRAGDLFELVEARAHSHPALLDGYRALLDDGTIERTDPARKGTFLHCSAESARRPEVDRHHDRLSRVTPPPGLCLCSTGVDRASAPPDDGAPDATWPVVPPMGPVPPALDETYPAAAEVPRRTDDPARMAAAAGVAALAEGHPDLGITLVHDDWPAAALDRLPDTVESVSGPAAPDEPSGRGVGSP